jgi:small subunit ribosomal protein S6
MRRYETIVIVRPGAGETDITSVVDKITGTIESFGGSIVKCDKWGVRKLAYPIKKESQGSYLLFEYAGMPDGVKEMERQMRIDDRILKFMTVKTQDVFKEIDLPPVGTIEGEAETADEVSE